MESTSRPKTERRKEERAVAPPPMTVSIARSISRAEIARRAFEYFCARGRTHGQDLDDWLRAERELVSPPSSPPSRQPVAAATDSPARRQPRKRAPRKGGALDS